MERKGNLMECSRNAFVQQMLEIDPNGIYHNRCIKNLTRMGAPITDWSCGIVRDVRKHNNNAPLMTCEVCGCPRVRFVHEMQHKDYPLTLYVGCICAGVIEGDVLAAAERENVLRKRAERKKYFLKKTWNSHFVADKVIEYKGHIIYAVGKTDGDEELAGLITHYSVGIDGEYTIDEYNGMPIGNLRMAKCAAFDMIEATSDGDKGLKQ